MKPRLARSIALACIACAEFACSRDLPEDAPAVLVFTRTTEYRHQNIESGVEKPTDLFLVYANEEVVRDKALFILTTVEFREAQ